MQNKSHRSLIQCFAVFITLSVPIQAEGRQCYWCGPLADQVHRSQVAPPCGDNNPVTDCDPGYDYCAVIAASPPHVESRLCVKLYQDECYYVYCNTTKSFRTTCPCKGDLCNGPNMEREKTAFAHLTKLVAKARPPIKKRSVPSDNEMQPLEDNNIIQNSSSDDVEYKNDNNNLNSINVEGTTKLDIEHKTTPMIEIDKNEIKYIVTPSLVTEENENKKNEHCEEKDKKENEQSEEQMQGDQPGTTHSNTKKEQTKDTFDIILKTSDQVTTMSVNSNKNTEKIDGDKNSTHMPTHNNKDISPAHQVKVETTTATNQKAKDENTHMNDALKSNANLPPAQALQQDSTPVTTTQKTEQTMTTLVTETHVTMMDQTTTKAMKNSKNNAVGICLHIVLIVKWLIFYLYL